MSDGRAGATAAHRVGSGANRLVRAWRRLPHERRLAAYACIGLFLTLFLPWYQETVFVASSSGKLQGVSQSLTGWGAFSFVEAAVLLVGVGVLTLLLQRAEGRAFHIPGGDGGVITAAGVWTSLLVVWRIFDKQGTNNHGQILNSSGIEWGIFVALAVATFLAYAGTRIRAAHQPEPPLPGEPGAPPAPPAGRSEAAQSEPEPLAAGQSEPRRPTAPQSPDSDPPATTPPQSGPPAAARRERVRPAPERAEGWLTAPPASDKRALPPDSPAAWDAPEFSYEAKRPARHPKPVPAEDPPTEPTRPVSAEDPPTVPAKPEPEPDAPLPPSTAAARRQQPPDDDQLTMRLEHED
jgi:hypothetical protein